MNGDGRPDLYVAGYTEDERRDPRLDCRVPDEPPRRPRRALPEPRPTRSFREVGAEVGLDPTPYDHTLGAVFTDLNGDGRPDLYVANDEDPNRLYLNEPGGPLGFQFVDRAKKVGVADPNAGMGIADGDYNGDGRPTSSSPTHAARRTRSTAAAGRRSRTCRPRSPPRSATNFTGWGDSWVDLEQRRDLELVLANGVDPGDEPARRTPAPIQVLENVAAAVRDARPRRRDSSARERPRGRGGGLRQRRPDRPGGQLGRRQLVLLARHGAAGHWLEVTLAAFAPGAVVTASSPTAASSSQEVHAGSSYLSSEDPRVHFGLGNGDEGRRADRALPGRAATTRMPASPPTGSYSAR